MIPLDQAIANWHLTTVLPLAETPTSLVFRADSPDFGAVVLKRLKPYGIDELQGVALLQWLDGDGAARIFDVRDSDILMEYVGADTLGDMVRGGDDAQAMTIAADILAALQKPRPHPPEMRSLREQFNALLTHNPNKWETQYRDAMRYATHLATTLLDEDQPQIPLHGDFHHDNILRSDSGWKVIDPKGLIGDAYYEATNLFQNPVGASDLALNNDRIDQFSHVIAARMNWKRGRLLGWATAHAALSMCWHVNSGGEPDFGTQIVPALINARSRAVAK